MQVHLYVEFFQEEYSRLSLSWALHPQIQITMKERQYFSSTVGKPQMGKTNCMHCFTPFYTKDLSIHRFGYLGTNPHGYQEMTRVKIWGSQKLYADVWLCMSVGDPNSCIVRGLTVLRTLWNHLIYTIHLLYCLLSLNKGKFLKSRDFVCIVYSTFPTTIISSLPIWGIQCVFVELVNWYLSKN